MFSPTDITRRNITTIPDTSSFDSIVAYSPVIDLVRVIVVGVLVVILCLLVGGAVYKQAHTYLNKRGNGSMLDVKKFEKALHEFGNGTTNAHVVITLGTSERHS